MKILVTNAQEVQAYTIIRQMRDHASKIAITVGGTSVRVDDFAGMACYSRYVDSKHEVPHFAGGWTAGNLSLHNTPAEEAYIKRIEQICSMEGIDTIIPSLDPEIYVFSKNKARLLKNGVTVVVPEPEIVFSLLDKSKTLEAAERAGFPIPVSHRPKGPDDIETIIENFPAPWVVKPRISAHMKGVEYAANARELRRLYNEAIAVQAEPLVQQYIPGTQRCHYYITVDRNHEIISLLQPNPIYVYADGVSTSIKSVISDVEGPLLPELRDLVRELRLWGGYTVQTKVDPVDNVPRLLEINPRFGHHLWYRTEIGVNEPLICTRLARNEEPDTNTKFPVGVALLDPYHDLFYFLESCLRKPKQELEETPQTPISLLRLHKEQYLTRRKKVFCPQFRHFGSDPYPCLRSYAFKANSRLILPIIGAIRKRLRARFFPAIE